MNYGKHEGWSSNYEQRNTESSDNSDKSLSSQNNKQERHVTWTEEAKSDEKNDRSNNRPSTQTQDSGHTLLLKGSYTQNMVNPTQLSKYEFTNWMEKLMEAHKNRQERKEHPYRAYRKPYNATEQGSRRPQLRNQL